MVVVCVVYGNFFVRIYNDEVGFFIFFFFIILLQLRGRHVFVFVCVVFVVYEGTALFRVSPLSGTLEPLDSKQETIANTNTHPPDVPRFFAPQKP